MSFKGLEDAALAAMNNDGNAPSEESQSNTEVSADGQPDPFAG